MLPRLLALTLILASVVAAAVAGTSRAQETGSTAMSFSTFQPRGWDQFRWANRALDNRCRPAFNGMEAFAGKPLSKVLPGWRRTKLERLTNKHHRMQEKSSLCKPWPDWWERGALCIHSYEGSWTDPNPKYYGGMQMDYSFMTTYGPEFYKAKGTADHWTPYEQLLASWRAYSSGRGWGPWPLTRTYCGL